MENKNKILKHLQTYIEQNELDKIKALIDSHHIVDVYEEIKNYDLSDIVKLLDILDDDIAADLLYSFDEDIREDIIDKLNNKQLKSIVQNLHADEVVDILEELEDEEDVEKVLKAANKEQKKQVKEIQSYEEHQVGSEMMVDFISVQEDWTIAKARKEIKFLLEEDNEITGAIWVVNKKGELTGQINAEDFITKSSKTKIKTHTEATPSLKPDAHLNDAADTIEKYDLHSVPIVDENNILLGVIESDVIIEHMQIVDDALDKRSLKDKEDNRSYFEIPVNESVKKRAPWLVLLLVIGILTQLILIGFQLIWAQTGLWLGGEMGTLTTAALIVTLSFTTSLSVLSSINDAGGNSGSQVSSTIVRALAIGEVNEKNYNQAIKKELKIGFRLATILAVVGFIRTLVVWLLIFSLPFVPVVMTKELMVGLIIIALVAAVAFFFVIIIGNVIATLIPIWTDKKGSDGAIISGPLQTTVVDILAIVIYLGLTTLIFVPIGMNIDDAEVTTSAINAINAMSYS